ncbi:MAG TPA: PEGA domain-containing protein [Polyangia bacterium]|jgi:tetratricopeptide (TPR) repeat protein
MRRRSHIERALAAALALTLALPLGQVAAGAGAPQVAKIFMVRIQAAADVSPLIQRRLNEQLRNELGTAETIDLLADEEAVTAGGVGLQAVDLRDEAKKHLEQGREALGRSEYAKAAELFRQAIKAFEDSVAVLDDVKPIAYASVLLAIAEGRRNRDDASAAAFTAALVLHPASKPDLAAQPARIRKAYDKAKKSLKKATGGATVTSQPEGATVSVDGQEHGAAPALVDLAPGVHYVRAARPGFAPAGARIAVKAGETIKVPLRLTPESGAAAGGGDALKAAFHGEILKRVQSGVIDSRLRDVAQRFCDRAKSAYLLVGHVSRGPEGYLLRSYLYRKDGNRLIELDAVKLDAELVNLSAGLYKLAEGVTGATKHFPEGRDITTAQLDLGVRGGGAGGTAAVDNGPVAVSGETGPRIDIKPPIWRTWWFWTVVGVVVAGGAAATGVVLLQPHHDGLYGGPVTVK